jgi:hypothetical protein
MIVPCLLLRLSLNIDTGAVKHSNRVKKLTNCSTICLCDFFNQLFCTNTSHSLLRDYSLDHLVYHSYKCVPILKCSDTLRSISKNAYFFE